MFLRHRNKRASMSAMPSTKKPNALESQVNAIVAHAAAEIAAAVRQEIAAEIQKVIGAREISPAPSPSAVAVQPPAPRAKPKGGRPAKASKVTAFDDLLSFVTAHPGLRSEEIVKQLGGGGARIKAGLATLFQQGKVQRAGRARGTTYSAVSAGEAAAEAAAPEAAVAEAAPAHAREEKVAAAAKKPAGAKKPAAKQPKPQKGKKFIRRTPEEIAGTVAQVLAFVAKNAGLRTEQILKQFGGDPKEVKNALERLRADKKVKTKGIKRAMTYAVA